MTGFVSGTSRASPQPPIGDNPPIKEIEVVQSDKLSAHSSSAQGIPLSPDIVMEVFPYHVIFDASFKSSLTSSLEVFCLTSKTQSVKEALITGTLIACPFNLPFNSG